VLVEVSGQQGGEGAWQRSDAPSPLRTVDSHGSRGNDMLVGASAAGLEAAQPMLRVGEGETTICNGPRGAGRARLLQFSRPVPLRN
jgi:hypothetical protein